MKKTSASQLLKQMTEGFLSSTTDFLLFELFLIPAVMQRQSSNAICAEAEHMLEAVNYQTIKQTLYYLTKKKLVSRSAGQVKGEYAITELGKKRINALLPSYHTSRPWDGHIYLISYDIPAKANRMRDLLRSYIARTGGALLQESLWINPYNPTGLLEEFFQTHQTIGAILISKLGKDGAIGKDSLEQLIARVYRLDKLAARYEKFINTYQTPSHPSKTTTSLAYLSILKDDPQLPFELLPKDFPAEKAYLLYRKLLAS